MSKPQHAHKYLRVKMGKDYTVLKCILSGCSHFIRPELAIGKVAVCWRCGLEFTMNQRSTTYKKPHCLSCTKFKAVKEANIAENMAASVMRRLAGGQ